MSARSASIDLLARPSFRETVKIAAHMLRAPMAAITVLGTDRQWFKASTGLAITSTTLEDSFCRYTVTEDKIMIVEDALSDPRFAANPLVVGSPHIRSYIGAPLDLPDGSRIGAVCALDRVPRRFNAEDQSLLRVLSRHAVAQFQLESLIAQQAGDIKDLREIQADLAHQARHDALTGLLNRRGLVQQLDLLLGPANTGDPQVTVLFIDLNDFKAINDNMSHETGDRVLAIVGKRLRSLVREGDLVARLGGDEFIVALVGSPERRVQAKAWAQRVLDAICTPVTIDGVTLSLGASVGVAESSATISAAQLIDHADQAMYRVKHSASVAPRIWSPDLNSSMEEERSVRTFVRSCIEREAITMHYQPIIDLEAGKVQRREALLRWNGTAPTALDPRTFVSIAESTGLIVDLGRLVLTKACGAAAAWQREEPGVGVSVNVSAMQVVHSLIDDIQKVLESSQLPSELLTLEITESSLLERTESAPEILQWLHDLGVRISMDDFGTGYSSMAMLCRLPIDEVKIDRQICAASDAHQMMVANASIRLGQSLGLDVVAEGIETRQILDRVVDMGCRSGQGFLLGVPSLLDDPAITSEDHPDG